MRDATRVLKAATPPAAQGEGCEHVQDLIDDLAQALDAARLMHRHENGGELS